MEHPLALMVVTLSVLGCHGGLYTHFLALQKDKLHSELYNSNMRPLVSQEDVLHIRASFRLVALVRINDVSQSFTCNGFLVLHWNDEILAWNASDYGNLTVITPDSKDIWKPRMILTNSLEDRDPFKDDFAPLSVNSDGRVSWQPGGLFTTSCHLDMRKYPFDQQICSVQFLAMLHSRDQLLFQTDQPDNQKLYRVSSHGEWQITNSSFKIIGLSPEGDKDHFSGVEFSFTLRRKPLMFMLTVMLPVVFLSFLNILVFLIPPDSGEKISYGMTVLLSLSVFMDMLQEMLPSSTRYVPSVTVYFFSMLCLAVLSVLSSILVVYLHHKQEKVHSPVLGSTASPPCYRGKFSGSLCYNATSLSDGRFSPFYTDNSLTNVKFSRSLLFDGTNSFLITRKKNTGYVQHSETNPWKILSKRVNTVSCAAILTAWLIFTAIFVVYIT